MNEFVSPKNATELLTRTIELLSDSNRWTKGYMAKDEYGEVVQAYEGRAKCFCIMGAIERGRDGVIGNEDNFSQRYANPDACDVENDVFDLVNAVLKSRYDMTIPQFNDNPFTTHDDVISVLNQALADSHKVR